MEITMKKSGDRSLGIISSYWLKVGQCTKCMRQAAIVCIFAWLATIFAAWLGSAEITYAIGVFAMITTALSIVHITTYALRKVATAERMGARLNRRQAFQALLGSAGTAFFIMAANRPAQASSGCGGWEGECDVCERNFRLDGNPSGCTRCPSCNRKGRDCGSKRC